MSRRTIPAAVACRQTATGPTVSASGAPSSNIALTATVKAIQDRKGSRRGYAAMEAKGGWKRQITPGLEAFISAQRSVFLATANRDGQPYIQHRGGPPGFLWVLHAATLGFADYTRNQQFISQGKLAENPRAHLFMIDYSSRSRVKICGEARVVENDPELVAGLMPPGYDARPQQAILYTVRAWDANCPQHIPQRFEAEDVAVALAGRDARIAELERALAAARSEEAHC